MRRRDFLASLGALAPERKPNIVLVLLDDLGYGDFGCYGQKIIQTPVVDRLAGEGTRFTDCYAGGAVCAPSRAALMTGLHGGHAPVRANAGTIPIEPGDVTIAEVLKKAGYATGGFGKWGLGDAGTEGRPTAQGFDEWFGYLHQVHAHSYYTDYLWDGDRKVVLEGNRDGKRQVHSADLIKDRTLEFVRKNRAQPFFCYAAWTLPHAKFEIPDFGAYAGRTDWHENERAYAAMVSRADSHIGELMGVLKAEGLERDTLVIVASDNGAHDGMNKGFERFRSNGALRGTKGTLYEGGIRVPMIARWPGRVPAGRVSAAPCAFWDLLPTFAEVGGAEGPRGMDGVSLMPEILGKGLLAKREALYWEFHNFNLKTMQMQPGWQQAARMGQWKAIRLKPGAPVELYDLSADPSESRDVAASNREVVERMERILREYHTPPRPHNKGRATPVTDL
jgi:arylsulfatase A-like enzyme